MMWDRARWSSRSKFIVYVTTFIFSPNTLWEFPIVWKAGGGICALIPLIICAFTLGLPIMFLELSLGQFMQGAGTRIWGVAPLFKGLTLSSSLVAIFRITTYLPIMSWACYYLFLSLTNGLPSCVDDVILYGSILSGDGGSSSNYSISSTEMKETVGWSRASVDLRLSYEEQGFKTLYTGLWNDSCTRRFERVWWIQTLEASPSLMVPGAAVSHVFVGVVVVTVLCFVVLLGSFNITGKVMYFLTPLSGIFLLVLLLGAGLNGRGFDQGIGELLAPNMHALLNTETWTACVRQAPLIFGLGVQVLPNMASYQRFSNDCYKDWLALSSLAVSIHVISAVVVFAILGIDAVDQPVTDISQDPSFLFLLVARSVSRFQNPTLWSPVFYAGVILVTFSTTAVLAQSLVLTVMDLSPRLLKWRQLIVAAVLGLCFLFATPQCTQGGIYLHAVYYRASSGGVLPSLLVLLQCFIMGHVYGGKRFYDNLGAMTGRQLHWWFRICWAYVAPLILVASIGYHGYSYYEEPISLGVEHPYHYLSSVLLLSMVVMMLMPVVAVAVWVLFSEHAANFSKRLRAATRPKLRPYQIPITWRLNANRKRMLQHI